VKWHHPTPFLASLINSQPMGFYQPGPAGPRRPRARGGGARARRGLSDWDCTLEAGRRRRPLRAVRLGLRQIKGFKQDDAEA
jgi:error-prone DNA polymerase